MKKSIVLVTLAICSISLFSAWWFYWPIHQTKERIKQALNDPDSAMFSNVVFHRNTGGACGVVNAKNRMGGYTGGTRFSIAKSGELRFDPNADMETESAAEKVKAIKEAIVYLTFALDNCPESDSTNKPGATP